MTFGMTCDGTRHSEVPVPYGGCCTPTLHMYQGAPSLVEKQPYAKMEGPTLFGGCSELCCDYHFPISTFNGPSKQGDLAEIIKRAPDGATATCRALFSTADEYEIVFKQPNMPVDQKASVLTSALLMDFMLFERGPRDKCGTTQDGKAFYINLFNCFCAGCVCPCRIYIPTGKK